MGDQFSVPKYGVILHPTNKPQRRRPGTQKGFREWLSVECPCFYIKERAFRFSSIMLLSDNTGKFALVMKCMDVFFAITPSISKGVVVDTYRNGEPFTNSDIGTLKGYLRSLIRGLSSKAVFSVASELFPVSKMTPIYSFIRFDSGKKPKMNNPKPPKQKPSHPAVLIKKGNVD